MLVGPGPRFELGRKAPQASMLPSYTTPAAAFYLILLGSLLMFDLSLFLFSERFGSMLCYFIMLNSSNVRVCLKAFKLFMLLID